MPTISSLCVMDSELLLKFIGYFPDYLLALSRTLLRFFGLPLSKQLFTKVQILICRVPCVFLSPTIYLRVLVQFSDGGITSVVNSSCHEMFAPFI